MRGSKRDRRAGPAAPARCQPVEMTPEEAADSGAFREDCIELDEVLAAGREPEGGSGGLAQG